VNNNVNANNERRKDLRLNYVNNVLNRNAGAAGLGPQGELAHNMHVLNTLGIPPVFAMGLNTVGHNVNARSRQNQLNLGFNQNTNQNQLLNRNLTNVSQGMPLNSSGNLLDGSNVPPRAGVNISATDTIVGVNNGNQVNLESQNSGNEPEKFLQDMLRMFRLR
jgi:hypothetical protein